MLTFCYVLVFAHVNIKNNKDMSSYSYTYIKEYLPVRYSATLEQKSDRQIVYDFKDGYCGPTIKKALVDRIKEIRRCVNGSNWRICFIPASTRERTSVRYRMLADFFQRETGIPCCISTIETINDEVSGHLGGKKANPAENFRIKSNEVSNMNIILIDDVITRGNTFVRTADKLVANGAKQVVGLFLAKTINPDWVSCSA